MVAWFLVAGAVKRTTGFYEMTSYEIYMPARFTDRLDVTCERKWQVENNTKGFGLNRWKGGTSIGEGEELQKKQIWSGGCRDD